MTLYAFRTPMTSSATWAEQPETQSEHKPRHSKLEIVGNRQLLRTWLACASPFADAHHSAADAVVELVTPVAHGLAPLLSRGPFGYSPVLPPHSLLVNRSRELVLIRQGLDQQMKSNIIATALRSKQKQIL